MATLGGIRLVATDLDGTLLQPDGTVSKRTVRAVRLAQDAGVYVVPVTGRPPRVTWDVAAAAGLGPLGVCSNGAVLVDIEARQVVATEHIARDVSVGLVLMLRELFPGCLFAAEEMGYFMHEAGFMEPQWDWDKDDLTHEVPDIVPAMSESCVKLVLRRPGWTARDLLSDLQTCVGAKGHVTSSGLDWVEIGAPGVSKAYALDRVCRQLRVDVHEVIAIGDNHNDLTVLSWAGIAAAPANAIPEVLAVADRVLPANYEDGVAQLLEILAER